MRNFKVLSIVGSHYTPSMHTPSVKHLADFLNHGVLPFVGRDTETSRVFQFWRSTIDASGLRTLLLVGEAGIGKSRLIEEVISQIVSSGGAVVHLKLYPESATTITPLLARSLWRSVAGRELLTKEPEHNRTSLVESLRRIASLRPTVIIIEDIHLLSSEGIKECAAILESLAEETISLITAARPTMNAARSILERYLREEIHLEGLDRAAFNEVCSHLFDSVIEANVIKLLQEATLGNALALRSALRGALGSGYLDNSKGRWGITVTPEAFTRHLENNVRSLSEGMAAHLDADETGACIRLAVLGELFAVEAAESIPEVKPLLDRLRFKGMIITSSSAQTPLSQTPTNYPLLAFSHSLLHKFFYDRSESSAYDLIELLAKDIPIYNIAPFLKLASLTIEPSNGVSLHSDILERVVRKADGFARALDVRSDWELALLLWNAAWTIFDKHRAVWEPDAATELDIFLTKTHLILLRRRLQSPEFEAALQHMTSLTTDPQTLALADHRMAMYVFRHWYLDRQRNPQQQYQQLRADAAVLLEAFPDLRYTHTYSVFLSYEAKSAAYALSVELIPELELAAKDILDHPNTTERLRSIVIGHVYPHFLILFDSKKDLQERLELAKRIEEQGSFDNVMFPVRKIEMLSAIGKLKEASVELKKHIPLFYSEGLYYTMFRMRLDELSIEAAFGRPLDQILTDIRSLFPVLPPDMHTQGMEAVAEFFIPVGALLGANAFVKTIIDEFGKEHRERLAEYYLLASLLGGDDPRNDLAECSKPRSMLPFYRAAIDAFNSEQSDTDRVIAQANLILSHEIVQQSDILNCLVVIEILTILDCQSVIQEQISATITAILEWLAVGEIAGYIAFIIKRYGKYLALKELKTWKTTVTKFGKHRIVRSSKAGAEEKLLVSMLGTIEIVRADGEADRVRGARLRSVLGMMTANLMLKDPLSSREFRSIAAGEKEDTELARKTVNMAVASLRDDLGIEAINTTGDTPALNLDHLRIDLLEASDLLDDAAKNVRRGSLVKALPLLIQAFDLALGKVPFPTLYDNLFEALRDDFDARIRKVTLELAKRLLVEGDSYSAASLLKRYFDVIPHDEEVAELLTRSLEETGQKAEAERINIKKDTAVSS